MNIERVNGETIDKIAGVAGQKLDDYTMELYAIASLYNATKTEYKIAAERMRRVADAIDHFAENAEALK